MHPLCIEVGCHEYMSQSFEWMCKVLGLIEEERKELKHEAEKIVLQLCHHGSSMSKGMATKATLGCIQMVLSQSLVLGSSKMSLTIK